MAKKPSASLIAHKVINLAGDMTAAEKRILAVLIDHYNFTTTQCDPALNSISTLLLVSRRTVIRGINALVLKGYLQKEKHGGKFYRNAYQPNWARFQSEEERWAAHRKQSRKLKSAPNVAPYEGQICHIPGDSVDTITNPLISSPETSRSRSLSGDIDTGEEAKGHSGDVNRSVSEYFEMPESAEVALRVFPPSVEAGPDGLLKKAVLSGAQQLQRRVKRDLYISWFFHLKFERKVGRCLVFSVPTLFKKTKINDLFPSFLEQCFCPKILGTSEIEILARA